MLNKEKDSAKVERRGGPRPNSGGARSGAGRKAVLVERMWINFASEVLAAVDAKKIAISLLNSKNPRIKADTLCYFLDRILGKPAQALTVAGDPQRPLEVVIQVIGHQALNPTRQDAAEVRTLK